MKEKVKYEEALALWKSDYQKFVTKLPERHERFTNQSGIQIDPLYLPKGTPDPEFMEKISFPGQYPFTRGIYPSMYRNRIWTKRQLVGFGGPEDWNHRTRMLLAAGQTGTNATASSVSMRGLDTDQMAEELHRDYVGLYGTPLDSILDIEIALQDIPIDRISCNYSDQGPFVSTAMHFAEAKGRGLSLNSISGTTNHADCLSHWSSCQCFVLFPLDAHLRLTIDLLDWCTRNAKRWHPLTITGQHHSQAGATPVQEVAFTLSAGITYIEESLKKGLKIDEFALRIGAFFDGQINIFEMASKLRAARRVWAKLLRERFGSEDFRSWQLPVHVQTSGVELTRQMPHLNIARVALQVIGAILGGTNSLHADSWDEAIQIPSEEAALIALLTQHVAGEETGIADVIDPLGGSYYFEALTDAMEQEIWKLIRTIDSLGGMKKVSESGWIYSELTKSTNRQIAAMSRKEKIIVGVNEYVRSEEGKFKSTKIDVESVERQIQRTKQLKKKRDQAKAGSALAELKRIADTKKGNLFEGVMNAVEASCTRGEIVRTLQDVFGKPYPPCSI